MKEVDSDISRRSVSELVMYINMAWDGANEDDADCEYIIGAVSAHAKLKFQVRKRLSEATGINEIELLFPRDERLTPEYWSKRASGRSSDKVGAKLARRMLDQSISSADKEHNLISFPGYLQDMLQKSEYWDNL